MLRWCGGSGLEFWIKLHRLIWIHICKVGWLINAILRSMLLNMSLSLNLLQFLIRQTNRILRRRWWCRIVIVVANVCIDEVVDLLLALCCCHYCLWIGCVGRTMRVRDRFNFRLLLLQQQHHHYLLLLLIIVTLAGIALNTTGRSLFLATTGSGCGWNTTFRSVCAREMGGGVRDTSQNVSFRRTTISIFLKHPFHTLVANWFWMMVISCTQEVCPRSWWFWYVWRIGLILMLRSRMLCFSGCFRSLEQLALIWRILGCVALRIWLWILLLH